MNNKKVFSVELFIHNFLQLKLMGILSTVLVAMLTGYYIISEGMSQANYTAMYGYEIGSMTTGITGRDISFLAASFILVTPLLMLMAFNYNNKRSSSDFFNSLPFTRLNLYLTNIAAVMAWIVILYVVDAMVIVASISAYKSYFVYSAGSLALIMFGMFVTCILCASAIAIAGALTGNIISNICLTGLILFLPTLIKLFINSFVEVIFEFASDIQAVPLIGNDNNLIGSFARSVFLGGSYNVTSIFTDKGNIAFSIILAAIYFVIGYLLFARRKSEIAGKAAVGNKIQACIRVIIGFIIVEIVVICIVAGVDSSAALTVVLALIMGYIAIFVYELLTGEKASILKKCAISYIISYIVAAVFTTMILIGANSMKAYVADADDISYIRIEKNSSYYYSDYYNDMINQLKISDKDVIATIADKYNYCSERKYSQILAEYDYSIYSINVYIKDGLIGKRRKVYLSEDEYYTLLSQLGNVKEYQSIYMNLPDSNGASFSFNNAVSISQDDTKKLYQSIREELSNADFAAYVTELDDSNVCDRMYVSFIANNDEYQINIPFNNVIPKSTALYMKLTNEASRELSMDAITFSDISRIVGEIVSTGGMSLVGTTMDVDILEINLTKKEQVGIYSNIRYEDDNLGNVAKASYNEGYINNLDETAKSVIGNAFATGTFAEVDPAKTFYQVNVRVHVQEDGMYSSEYYYFYVQ